MSGWNSYIESARYAVVNCTFSADPEWQDGWRVLVAASVGVGVSFGLFSNVAGLFIVPMQAEFGWPRTTLTIAPIAGLGSALLSPLVGISIDRFSSRLIALLGLIVLSSAILFIAAAPASRMAFYWLEGYLAFAASISTAMVYVKGIATWFNRHAGAAIGLMMVSLSLSGAIVLPALSYVIERRGWRTGFMTLVGIVMVIGFPLVFAWFRERPTSEKHKAESVKVIWALAAHALKDRRFWILLAFLACMSLPVGGFLSQLQPLLRSRELTAKMAASIGSLYVISAGIGRIGMGTLLDYWRPTFAAAICLLLSAVGAFALGSHELTHSIASKGLAVSLIGFSQGAEVNLMAFFTLRIFGVRSFAALFGLLNVVVASCMSVGGLAFSKFYDTYGNYGGAVYGGMLFYVCAAITVMSLQVPKANIPQGPAFES